jgi:pheromone shutdown protein TraB
MKIIELTEQLKIAITNEEADLLKRFDETTPALAKRDLDEREQIMANQLVNKSILKRTKDEQGRINYKRRTRENSSRSSN